MAKCSLKRSVFTHPIKTLPFLDMLDSESMLTNETLFTHTRSSSDRATEAGETGGVKRFV